ncbi:murein L,D-transpeptidase [Enterovirga sp. GCM10030262]|uniref:L,D-transpeptidase family protein n=1 Tax=Enterovirga sp. GCM10030262 TaxID=3273391 RepID=UPI003614CB9C
MSSTIQYSAGGPTPPAPLSPLRNRLLVCVAAAMIAGAFPAPALAQPVTSYEVAAEIRSSVNRELRTFYRNRGYRPLWIRNGESGPEADRLVELVASADLDGLDPSDYDPGDLRRAVERARDGSPEALAKAELKLSRTFADYVRDVRRPPSVKMVYLDKELEPERPTAAAVLRAAAVAPSLADYMDRNGWTSPFYARLREGLAEHRSRWAGLPEFTIPGGPALRPGSKGERVRMLRLRLGHPDGAAFDKALAATVEDFQAAHGLPVDGIVGATTIATLNRGSAHHARMIQLNLERARALPALSNDRHIVVDAAAQRLWLYENGEAVDTMKVIVGKPSEPTPMLAGVMRYAVVNPYWNVPPDLVRKSILPKLVDRGTTLRAMGYEALSDWTHDARVLEPDEIDWDAVASGRQELRVRQLPGKGNAMGKMKFMFPNDLGIYLHDTPDKALFDEEERRFSSGCVRVEDAPRLAKWLFGEPVRASSDEPEQQVHLDRPVPVYITYLTAAPTETGIAFREDAYGRDDGQLERLASR